MREISFDRKNFHELIWSYPSTSLVKKYELSHKELKLYCEEMNIPTPPKEYWQNRTLGSTMSVQPLPEEGKRKKVNLLLWEEGDENRPEYDVLFETLEREVKSKHNLAIFSKRLSNPDQLVLDTKAQLERKDRYLHDGLVNSFAPNLNVSVSPLNIVRAMQFLDSLIKLLRIRGHNIQVEGHETRVIINGQTLKVVFREKCTRERQEQGWTNLKPTGLLSLKCEQVFISREWTDGSELIEEKLPKILYDLELISIRLRERYQYLKKGWDKRDEEIRLAKEYQHRKEKELVDFKDLLHQAYSWREAKILREYINEIEAKAIAQESLSDDLKDWLKWARQKADWFDPLIMAKDELLDGVSRAALSFTK